MLFRIGRFAFVIALRLVVSLFRDHMLDARLRHYLQILQGIARRSERGKEAEIPLAPPLPHSPETPPDPKHDAT